MNLDIDRVLDGPVEREVAAVMARILEVQDEENEFVTVTVHFSDGQSWNTHFFFSEGALPHIERFVRECISESARVEVTRK